MVLKSQEQNLKVFLLVLEEIFVFVVVYENSYFYVEYYLGVYQGIRLFIF